MELPSTGAASPHEAHIGIFGADPVETRDFDVLSEEEKAVLQGIYEAGLREITPSIGPDGFSYEGLEEMRREYGEKRLSHLLEELASKGFLVTSKQEPVVTCPKCDSHRIAVLLCCTGCGSSNVHRAG